MIQFLKFATVGVFNTAIDVGLYYVLTRFFGIYFVIANIISVFCAMTFSYIINKNFTFENKSRKYFTQYGKFLVINGLGFLINNLILYLGVVMLGVHDLVAKIGAIGVSMVINFFAMKYWAFNEK